MFRLIRIGFTLAFLAGLFWVGTRVKLGERTFYEHIKAISESPASQELIEGTKQKVSEGVTDVGRLVGKKAEKDAQERAAREHLEKTRGKALAAGEDQPADSVTDADRKALRKLLESRP